MSDFEINEADVLVIHGPNLNMLGMREPHIYGSITLAEIDEKLIIQGNELGLSITCFQSNYEGEIVTVIQKAFKKIKGLIINPAAYTHTSVAVRDAVSMLDVPIVEIHLSNIHKREPFRHHSYFADISEGRIAGFGAYGYTLALAGLYEMMKQKPV